MSENRIEKLLPFFVYILSDPNDFKPFTCIVYGYVYDHQGLPVQGAKVSFDGQDFFYTKLK